MSRLLPAGHPLTAGWLRALPAGLIALAVGRRLPAGMWWWRALALGALNIGLFFPLLFITAQRLPGGVAAVTGAVGPFVVVALSRPLLGLRPAAAQWLAACAAVVGVGMVALSGGARLDLLGVLTGVAGACSMSMGTVLTRRWGRPVDVFSFAGWQLTAGGLIVAGLAVLVEGAPPHLDVTNAAGYVWLGLLGGLVAYVLWFRGAAQLPPGQVGFLPLLSPVTAVLLGVVIADERLSLVQWLGVVVALASIAAAQLAGMRSARK